MILLFHRHRRLVSVIGLLVLAGFGLPAVLGAAGAFSEDRPATFSISTRTAALGDEYVSALEAGDAARLAALSTRSGVGEPEPIEQARFEIAAFGPSARAGVPELRVVARWEGGTELLEVRFADGRARVLMVVDGERIAGYGGPAGPLSA